uniref:Serine/threonine-protein phosphatase n=1 Tax=Globodera pallida TaxID=36090 RepID=A0A183BK77_GLOPA
MGLLNSVFGPAEPKPKQSNEMSPAKTLAHQIAAKVIGEMSLSAFTDKQIIQLMDAGIELFEKEPARVSLQAPCIIYGDIHGNLPYFLKFFSHGHVEPQILKLLPPNSNLLFLGDYVDRGDFSLELVALLVSLKVLFPNKVILLRGNHEVESTNRNYTFYTEVETKRTDFDSVYQACNKLFTKLPLCAVISNTFLCMHGGLPRPECWDALMGDNFEKPQSDGEIDDSNLYLDVLWSDVTNDANKLRLYKKYEPDMAMQGDWSNYRFNQWCNAGIEFNDDFVEKFCNRFPNIRGVFRAHRHEEKGHKINKGRTVCTVFSSPNYVEDAKYSGTALKLSADLKRLHFTVNVGQKAASAHLHNFNIGHTVQATWAKLVNGGQLVQHIANSQVGMALINGTSQLALPSAAPPAATAKAGGGSVCGRERLELLSDMDELESLHSSMTGAAADIGGGESDDENIESVAMVDSFGDQVENALDKRVSIRTKAMDNILLVLHKHCIPDNVLKWRCPIAEIIEKNLKRTSEEAVRACSLAALISLQLGVDIEDEMCAVLEVMRQICADASAGEAVRASCAQAIGICVYLSVESRGHRFAALQTLKNVWVGMKPTGTDGTSLFSSAIASWALLLERFEPSFITAAIDEVQPKMCAFLESTTVEARISAGEALATVFEIAVKSLGDDFRFRNHAELARLLGDLALDSSKQRAKRDKKLQRMTFRQLNDVLAVDSSTLTTALAQQQQQQQQHYRPCRPVLLTTVRFNGQRETLTVQGCHAKLLYDAMCQLLQSDLNRHLTSNEVLRELFDLGPVLNEDEPQKLTKAQKSERLSQFGEQQKQRNISRSKGRSKKMGGKHDFDDD